MPPANPDFKGRETELASIQKRLLAERTVVLRGMSGIGKTQLAMAYVYKFKNNYDIIGWIRAGRGELIANHIADVARQVGCATFDSEVPEAAAALLAELRKSDRWLLVIDNAETPTELLRWLPGGLTGHVLITTQAGGWGELAGAPIEVESFSRAESVAVLRHRVKRLTDADADALAHELGDLPLAIAQAANYLSESPMPAAEYLQELKDRPVRTLAQGIPAHYQKSVSAAFELTIERLEAHNRAAAELAEISAFLAAEPIPVTLFRKDACKPFFPEPLASAITGNAATGNFAFWDVLTDLLGRSVARVYGSTFVMHRLIQAFLRDRNRYRDGPTAGLDAARKILAAGRPQDTSDAASWSDWELLLPHVLAVDPAESADSLVRDLACDTVRYLLYCGDVIAARKLATELDDRWKHEPSDRHAMIAAGLMARVLAQEGKYAEARTSGQEILDRLRRTLGDDDPDTLTAASDLASYLRKLNKMQDALELDQDTLRRRKQVPVLGENHPDTLASASNLAADLARLNRMREAQELDEDTLHRRRQVLRDDHPDTLASASNLAADLAELKQLKRALEINEDTLKRRRRTLGADHPAALSTANNLALIQAMLGHRRAAQRLAEDTLTRRRRVLGEKHPETLNTASNLADILAKRHRLLPATRLAERTLYLSRLVYGEEHPETVVITSNLIGYLRRLRRYRRARRLESNIAPSIHRVLGADHPSRLISDDDAAEYRSAWVPDQRLRPGTQDPLLK